MGLGDAIRENTRWGETWNGAEVLATTDSALLDMFGRAGSMRGSSDEDKRLMISRACAENQLLALKLLFYVRDVRGGYGERDTFRTMIKHIATILPVESIKKNLWAIMEFGRADDLYSLIGTPCEDAMWEFMKDQFMLDEDNMEAGKSISLLAKWIASPDSSVEKTKQLGKLTAKKLGFDFKSMSQYKKRLRKLRRYLDIPEAKMCSGKWSEIEYSKCASKFLFKYRNTIKKYDKDRWDAYLESVNSGEKKMNMSTVTPADIIYEVRRDYTPDLETMWKNLKNVCDANAMVICDTSSSMLRGYNCKSKIMPIDVAFGLALYFAQRNKGDLNNLMMNFSDEPEFIRLDKATLIDNLSTALRSPVNLGSTDLEKAFELLLRTLIKGNVNPEEMPEAIIIVSDMQINHVDGIGSDNKLTFYSKMKEKYKEAGYNMPQTIFWNVNAENTTFLASSSESGASLVSGFSPLIFKTVMQNIGSNPMELMLSVLNDERYAEIQL